MREMLGYIGDLLVEVFIPCMAVVLFAILTIPFMVWITFWWVTFLFGS